MEQLMREMSEAVHQAEAQHPWLAQSLWRCNRAAQYPADRTWRQYARAADVHQALSEVAAEHGLSELSQTLEYLAPSKEFNDDFEGFCDFVAAWKASSCDDKQSVLV